MASHPHLGIPQSKPRLPNGAPASREALAKLSAEYLAARNRQMESKSAMAEMELQRRGGQLIARYDAKVQLGFLLTGLRQRLMSFAYALPRRLAGKNEHEIGRIIDQEVRAALRDIVSWPERLADPNWAANIDQDLAPVPDGNGNGGGAGAAAKRECVNAGRRQKYAKAKEG